MTYTMDSAELKELLKTAMVEVLEEKRELVRDAVADAIEDIGLIRAIEEGVRSEAVSREEVFAVLQGRR